MLIWKLGACAAKTLKTCCQHWQRQFLSSFRHNTDMVDQVCQIQSNSVKTRVPWKGSGFNQGSTRVPWKSRPGFLSRNSGFFHWRFPGLFEILENPGNFTDFAWKKAIFARFQTHLGHRNFYSTKKASIGVLPIFAVFLKSAKCSATSHH